MKTILFITISLYCQSLNAQTDSLKYISDIVNKILEDTDQENEDSNIYNTIEELLENRVDINEATIDDLLKIPTIDLQTAQIIKSWLNRNGYITSLNDLYLIDDLNVEILNSIIPFLTLKGRKKTTEISSAEFIIVNPFYLNMRSRIITDIQDRRGIKEKKYTGSKFKYYNRIKAGTHNYKINLLSEKDAGEKSIADFYSFNLYGEDLLFLDKFTAGDYIIEFGQGLSLWGPYSFSKGSQAVKSFMKKPRGIVPYSGSDENQFFRGGALKLSLNKLSLSLFYSNNYIDANISELNSITSLPLTGYHRTLLEQDKNNSAAEKTAGLFLSYSPFGNLNVSLLHYTSGFSKPLISRNIYDLQGGKFNFYSFSYTLFWESFLYSGEISYNSTSVASLNNLQIVLNKNLSIALSLRSYPRNYFNIYSNGFGEKSNTKNELGFYFGIKMKIKPALINIYYDQFKFPFADNNTPIPTSGREYLCDILYPFSTKLKLHLRYKNEIKEFSYNNRSRRVFINRTKQNTRLEIINKISNSLVLKSRLEYSDIYYGGGLDYENGILLFQDIRCSPLNNLLFYLRLVFFETDSYDTRIYEFENDLPGVFSNHALSGNGSKWYFLIKYIFFDYFKLSLKYSELFLPESKFISSGLNEIRGNLHSVFSLQIECKL